MMDLALLAALPLLNLLLLLSLLLLLFTHCSFLVNKLLLSLFVVLNASNSYSSLQQAIIFQSLLKQ